MAARLFDQNNELRPNIAALVPILLLCLEGPETH